MASILNSLAIIILSISLIHHSSVHCPPLMATTTPIFKVHQLVIYEDENGKEYSMLDSNKSLDATTTLKSFTQFSEKIGEEIDQDAIEHNKRVKECETANGQF